MSRPVNEPLHGANTDVLLFGNDYARDVAVKNPDGDVVLSGNIPVLPQGTNLTSPPEVHQA